LQTKPLREFHALHSLLQGILRQLVEYMPKGYIQDRPVFSLLTNRLD
jgi:hypothetical protein